MPGDSNTELNRQEFLDVSKGQRQEEQRRKIEGRSLGARKRPSDDNQVKLRPEGQGWATQEGNWPLAVGTRAGLL